MALPVILVAPAMVLPVAGIFGLLTGHPITGSENSQASLPTEIAVTFGLPLLLCAMAWCTKKLPDRMFQLLPFFYGLAGTAIICTANFITSDAGVSGQTYYVLPVVFGGYLLKRTGAVLVASAAGLLSALNAVALAAPSEVVADITTLTITYVALAVVVSRARDREQGAHHALLTASRVDSLTQLATRKVAEESLEGGFERLGKFTGPGLILIDVDNFKQINDSHGHPVGDACLVHIAGLLRSQVGPTEIVSRMGGDELAIAVPHCVADTVQYRAAQVMSAVRKSPLILDDGLEIPLTVSVGFAHAPRDAETMTELYREADLALYDAKANGRNCVGLPPALRDGGKAEASRSGGRRQGTVPAQPTAGATEPESCTEKG